MNWNASAMLWMKSCCLIVVIMVLPVLRMPENEGLRCAAKPAPCPMLVNLTFRSYRSLICINHGGGLSASPPQLQHGYYESRSLRMGHFQLLTATVVQLKRIASTRTRSVTEMAIHAARWSSTPY